MLALQNVQSHQKNAFDNLNRREMETVLCFVNSLRLDTGATEHLQIAKKTVHTYQYHIFKKLDVKNGLELLRLALQVGAVELDVSPSNFEIIFRYILQSI